MLRVRDVPAMESAKRRQAERNRAYPTAAQDQSNNNNNNDDDDRDPFTWNIDIKLR